MATIVQVPWLQDELSLWNSRPISVITPLHQVGLAILQHLVTHHASLPSTPSSEGCISITGHAPQSLVPVSTQLVLADLRNPDQHDVFDFANLASEPEAGHDEIIHCMARVASYEIWSPNRRLYGAVNIPSSVSGIGQCLLTIAPFEGDIESHVEPEDWFSVFTLPSSITHTHADYYGASQYVVHISGRKLWMFWPASAHNLRVFEDFHEQQVTAARTLLCLQRMEGLELLLLEGTPTAFAMRPNTFHACISLSASTHTTKRFWTCDHREEALSSIEWGLRWIKRNVYSDITRAGLRAHLDRIQDDITSWSSLFKANSEMGDRENLGKALIRLESLLEDASSALDSRDLAARLTEEGSNKRRRVD